MTRNAGDNELKNAMWDMLSAVENMSQACKHMLMEHDDIQEKLEDAESNMEDMQERIYELTAEERAKAQGK